MRGRTIAVVTLVLAGLTVPATVAAQETSDVAATIVDLAPPKIVELAPPMLVEIEAGVRETDGEDEVVLALDADVFFAFDESELLPEARETLASVAEQLAEVDVDTLRVDGHTDSVGDDDYNQQLSEERAAAVADYLEEQLPDVSVATAGHGATQPAAPNEIDGEDYPEGRATNRRVEITY